MPSSFLRRLSFPRARKTPSTTATTDEKRQPEVVVVLPKTGEQHEEQQQQQQEADEPSPLPTPDTQRVLLLHGARQPYQLTEEYAVPAVQGEHEVLVRTQAIGLNPIDWKAPDFNFAIPELPYISGRELAGEVVRKPNPSSRLKARDRVLVISTDYRDLRKAAYQEYVVAFDYNTVRIPASLSAEEGSTLGVAFVAAVLSLGVCMGVDFSDVLDGPNLLAILRDIDSEKIPADVRQECLEGIQDHERAGPGDWLAIWGGSSTSANLTIQLAKLAGLKTVSIVNKAKHGLRLSNHQTIRTDLLVDSHDPSRAVDIIRANLQGKLRFGIDTVGRDTATSLLHALTPSNLGTGKDAAADVADVAAAAAPPSPPSTPHDSSLLQAHLIGLTGLPKQTAPDGVQFHTVPIKLFHEVPEVGDALVRWFERLLEKGLVSPPEIIDVETGLESINSGLDRMRRGEISGGKLVVRVA